MKQSNQKIPSKKKAPLCHRKKQIWKPGALLAPTPPVLVSCKYQNIENILTVAWCGMACTKPAMLTIAVRPERFSYPLIRQSGCFVVNLPTEDLLKAVDYCGVRSGKDVNKWENCQLTKAPANTVDSPGIAESPLWLECSVRSVTELGTHHLFLAEITGVQVSEALTDSKGRLCLERAGLLAYAHGQYFAQGKILGAFGYSVRKK